MAEARAPRATQRILVVDDNEPWLAALERQFRNAQQVVVGASDESDAFQQVVDGDFDLAVIDLFIDYQPSFGLIRKIKAHRRTLCTVVYTAHFATSFEEDALAAGADDFVSKDFAFTDVLARVEQGAPRLILDPKKLQILEWAEWEHITSIYRRYHYKISPAARCLQIDRRTLRRKLTEYAPKGVFTLLRDPY